MKVVAIILSFVCVTTWAQTYKVITVTDGVTIAGQAVTPGAIIEHSEETISISKGASVGLLTSDGYLGRLTSSTPISKLRSLLVVPTRRYTTHDDRSVFYPLIPDFKNSEIIGDSVFLYWFDNFPSHAQPRTLSVRNKFDEELYNVRENRPDSLNHWILLDVSRFRKLEELVIFFLQDGKKRDAEPIGMIKFRTLKNREAIELQMAPFANSEDKIFYEFVVYTLNDLYNDRSMIYYHILSRDLLPKDIYLEAYFRRQNEDKKLDLVKIK